jgi:HD-like signal output (HDOD) protein/ActR/RegA family two-component response regulator
VIPRPHVVFVDDEPLILGALRRMLRTNRDLWDMSFVDSGEAALALIRDRPCDVIVSDFRMPGMNGAQLLEHVRREHPGTARVILSGQTNEDSMLSIMVLAHEFLTKPSTPEQLLATVDRLISVRPSSRGAGPLPAVVDFESLPSAPHVLVELVAALDAEDACAQSISSIIEQDPATAAKVLHLVNSSAYTTGRAVSNVGQAVALLGMETVRGLVLMHDLVHVFDVTGALPLDWIDRLTEHSIEASHLCRLLAADTDWESHAFTAGLLHEVGQLALASSQPSAFAEAVTLWLGSAGDQADDPLPLSAAEAVSIGISHVQVGADLLNFWGLPAVVVQAAAAHDGIGDPTHRLDVSSAVSLAHLIVESELGPVCGRNRVASPVDESRLDAAATDAVSRWRRQLSRRR